MDEMFRQIAKKQHIDGKLQPLFGHPHLHRVLKDLAKFDGSLEGSSLDFSQQLVNVLTKNMSEALESRAVWILVPLVENERTLELVKEDLIKNKKTIQKMLSDSDGRNKGL